MRMNAKQEILSRLLPKTGQTVSYQLYDDGHYQYGWWKNRGYAANKIRFISKTIDTDKVLIDRATGLMWATDGERGGCDGNREDDWAYAIAYARGLVFAGFTNWRLPTILELITLIDFGRSSPAIDVSLFPNFEEGDYWTSTTAAYLSAMAWTINFTFGVPSQSGKTGDYYLRCVRTI